MNLLKIYKNSPVAKNAGWIIAGNIVQKLISLFIGLWSARYLGPLNFGLITYAGAYSIFFFAIATLGLNSIIVKKFIDNPETQGETLGTVLGLQSVSGLISSFVILGISSVLDFGEPLTILIVFLSNLGLFFQVFDSVKYWFQSKLMSKYYTVATLLGYIIISIYKLFLLISGKSVVWFAVSNSIEYVCIALFLYFVYYKKKGPRLKFSFKKAKEFLGESYHFILSGLMIAIYGATDKLMLKQILDEESVGYYGIAMTVALMWVFILEAIIDSVRPSIMESYNKDKSVYKKKNIQLYSIVFYLSLFVSLGITIFAKFGVNLLYGEAFMGAVAPLRVITWYVAFSYLGVARDIWIICEGYQKYIPKIYIASALINVVLNFCLIPVLGAEGAAAASLITQIATIFIPAFIKEMRPNVKMMLDAILLRSSK